MAKVKLIVTALAGYWCLGRKFEAGDTEIELEDREGSSIAEQLAQLDAAKGGLKLEQLGAERSNPEQRSPPRLTYRIVEDPPPPARYPFDVAVVQPDGSARPPRGMQGPTIPAPQPSPEAPAKEEPKPSSEAAPAVEHDPLEA